MKKIGILIIATNQYIQFASPLIESIRTYFPPENRIIFYVFTNQEIEGDDICRIEIDHRKWPGMTLYRYRIFSDHAEMLSRMDYLFYIDADMKVVDTIGTEILPRRGLVGVIHPGFYDRPGEGTYETNPNSTAYVKPSAASRYFAGGFNGGIADAFLKMASTLAQNIEQDETKGITAVWHDESHLNRYFFDHPPEISLPPSYCYPENWLFLSDKQVRSFFSIKKYWDSIKHARLGKKILALDKAHAAIRF